MKKLISVLLALVLVFSLAACGGNDDAGSQGEGEPIKIAVVGPLTGDYSEYGLGFQAAAEIAVEKWNNNGGINGRMIELESYDEKGTTEEGLAICQLLCGEDNMYGVVGHFESIMAVGGLYTEERISMIGPTASSAGFTDQGDCIFRLNATIYTETDAMLNCAADTNATKLGIVYLGDDWGTTAYQVAQDSVAARSDQNWEIVAAEEIAGGDMDYSAVISNLKSAGVETVLMFCYYDSVVPFTIKAKSIMPELNIVCGVNCYNDTFLEVGGAEVEGCLAPSVFAANSDDENTQYFVEKFIEKLGSTPSSLSAQAYDATCLLLMAIESTGGEMDREAIRDYLANNDYVGTTGSCAFDENRDAARDFKTMVVKNGEWVYYEG